MWFPKPAGPGDIEFVGPAGIKRKQHLFDLLTNEAAVEWRDRVGVAGPVDGSGKDTSRLLASDGWVLKTNMDLAVDDKTTAFEQTSIAVRTAIETQVWHADKIWAFFCFDGQWYPLSATPEMTTLRGIDGQEERLDAWTDMIVMAVDTFEKHGIGMDLNPANFGRLPNDPKLYYIDDEWYPTLRNYELAAATVSRIPEEPSINADQWEVWGTVLAKVLEPVCETHSKRIALVDAIADHPIAAKFDGNRKALLEGLSKIHPPRKKRRAILASGDSAEPMSERTALIADVHGNAIALDAVLEDCKKNDVDSYIFLGDAVGYGPQPRECVEKLAELPNARYVRGNHDHHISIGVFKQGMNRLAKLCAKWTYDQLTKENREWLMSLPLDLQSSGWVAVHGAPRDPRRFLAYVYELTYQDNLEFMADANLRLCFYGHTHVQSVYTRNERGEASELKSADEVTVSDDRILLVNPGSIGQPRDGDVRAAYAIWDRGTDVISLRRVEYAVADVVDQINELGLPRALGERLLIGE